MKWLSSQRSLSLGSFLGRSLLSLLSFLNISFSGQANPSYTPPSVALTIGDDSSDGEDEKQELKEIPEMPLITEKYVMRNGEVVYVTRQRKWRDERGEDA